MPAKPEIKERVVPEFLVPPELESLLQTVQAKGTPEALLLCSIARTSTVTRQHTEWQSPIMVSTEYQGKVTNGRVGVLENWKSRFVLASKAILYTTAVLIILYLLAFPNSLSPFAERVAGLFLR